MRRINCWICTTWIPEQDPSRQTPWEDADWGLFPHGNSEPWNCLKGRKRDPFSTRISCQTWRCYQKITLKVFSSQAKSISCLTRLGNLGRPLLKLAKSGHCWWLIDTTHLKGGRIGFNTHKPTLPRSEFSAHWGPSNQQRHFSHFPAETSSLHIQGTAATHGTPT